MSALTTVANTQHVLGSTPTMSLSKHTVLDGHMLRIRNIDVTRSDLIPSTVIDACCAIIQEQAEREGSIATDFCFFSSWLGPLVSGHANGRSVGSFCEHVSVATAQGSLTDTAKKERWAIPLCGGSPPYWVLGYVDHRRKELGVYDSIPELESHEWAEPLLLRILDGIHERLSMPGCRWLSSEWRRLVKSPKPEQRQLDAWSCGLFCLLAAEEFARGTGFNSNGNNHKDSIRTEALQRLLCIPITRREAEGQLTDNEEPEIIEHGDATSARRGGLEATAQAHAARVVW
ncbi:hypothetical protein FA95DRAFT_1612214 [Auriscalpium vulgare]|uniref:Uncharacterized protein n=1 Tax=Auriscalpium vulgare TaxID=40419 RepID=A0ACB8R750_9AGAM|nr:hypothetical protein FA95DRAFT_1612214 [Auriscalpium vulgare]